MNIVRLLATAIRILGIYLLLKILYEVWWFVYSNTYLVDSLADNGDALNFGVYSWIIIHCIGAVMMVVLPVKIAAWVVSGKLPAETKTDIEPQGLEVSAFVIIGVVIVARAIPDAITSCVWLWYQNTGQISDRLTVGSSEEFVIGLIIALLELAIGLYLVFGAKGLQAMVSKFRQAGVS